MFFLLTNFIYPIEEPISLSEHFGFVFDNVRTDEEIEFVSRLIKNSWDLSQSVDGPEFKRMPMEKEVPGYDVATFEKMIEKFLRTHKNEETASKQMTSIRGNEEAIIDFYCKNWVIIRFVNDELIKEADDYIKYKKEISKKQGGRLVFLIDGEDRFSKRLELLVAYCYVISLLTGDEEYFGWCFLITQTQEEVANFYPNIPIMGSILEQNIGLYPTIKPDPSAYRYNFGDFVNSTSFVTNQIDEKLRIQAVDKDTILYIGKILKVVSEHRSEFSALVNLVSIIELLLTHQPNFNRFNVEDSISKQFVLKTSITLERHYKVIDLNEIKFTLKEIYNLRSNIVHGNFNSVNKYIRKLNDNDDDYSRVIVDCYNYCRIVLTEYISHPHFIKFLKEN